MCVISLSRSAILISQMLPAKAVGRHQLRCSLKSFDRIAMTPLLPVSQTEVFPHRSILGGEARAFAQVSNRRISLTCRVQTKSELGLHEKIPRCKLRGASQWRNRLRHSVQVDVAVANGRQHAALSGESSAALEIAVKVPLLFPASFSARAS